MRRFFWLVLLLLTVAGCSRDTAGHERSLVLGLNDWSGYQPFFLAQQRYLPDGALKIVEVANNTEQMRLFRNGILDLACLTLDEALRLSQRVEDLKVIAVLDYSSGADAVVARPGISSLQELAGKRIGYEKGGVGSYMLLRLLQQAQLLTEEVTLVPLASHEHEEVFSRGRVDAVITFEPMASRLQAKGGIRLFDSAMIPGEVIDVLVVRSSLLEERAGELASLLDAWFRASGDVTDMKPEAIAFLSKHLHQEKALLENAFQKITFPSKKESQDFMQTMKIRELAETVRHLLANIGQYAPQQPEGCILEKEKLDALY